MAVDFKQMFLVREHYKVCPRHAALNGLDQGELAAQCRRELLSKRNILGRPLTDEEVCEQVAMTALAHGGPCCDDACVIEHAMGIAIGLFDLSNRCDCTRHKYHAMMERALHKVEGALPKLG